MVRANGNEGQRGSGAPFIPYGVVGSSPCPPLSCRCTILRTTNRFSSRPLNAYVFMHHIGTTHLQTANLQGEGGRAEEGPSPLVHLAHFAVVKGNPRQVRQTGGQRLRGTMTWGEVCETWGWMLRLGWHPTGEVVRRPPLSTSRRQNAQYNPI